MKYVILHKNEITQEILNEIAENGGIAYPEIIWKVDPPQDEPGGEDSEFRYVTTVKDYPDSLRNYRKYNQDEFDTEVASLREGREINNKNSGRVLLDTPKSKDGRITISSLRSEPGYTVFPTGQGDNITTGVFRDGDELVFDKNNLTKDFQLLHHWYAIGGRIRWEDADMRDYMDATLIAPATSGTQITGNYNKIEIAPSSGMHVFVPTSPGTGTWDLDLTETHGPTEILKCTPVPVAGNTGFFDYDSQANVLTPNLTQTGGYNLYDFDAQLFSFARKIWGSKLDGLETVLEVPDIEGKKLYNSWKIRFTLSIHDPSNRNPKAAVIMTTSVLRNI